MSKKSSAILGDGEKVRIVRPSGASSDLERLPPAGMTRWVMRRKAQVVAAVRNGLLSFEEACQRYRLSEEEFKSWMALMDRHGVRGLRATRAQQYRGGATDAAAHAMAAGGAE